MIKPTANRADWPPMSFGQAQTPMAYDFFSGFFQQFTAQQAM